jgi:hypothetical protein
MENKPCIVCKKDCEIWPVQLGDLFTLCYLRVCSHQCLFLLAYEFMHTIYQHKQFRGKLYNMQNEEDKKLRDDFVKEVTDESLKMMRDSILLSLPVSEGLEINLTYDTASTQPLLGSTMRFTRFSKEQMESLEP